MPQERDDLVEVLQHLRDVEHILKGVLDNGCGIVRDEEDNLWVRNLRAEAAERELAELKVRVVALEEIRKEKNAPVKYITVGSVIFALWGTSSIAYVDQLRNAARTVCGVRDQLTSNPVFLDLLDDLKKSLGDVAAR